MIKKKINEESIKIEKNKKEIEILKIEIEKRKKENNEKKQELYKKLDNQMKTINQQKIDIQNNKKRIDEVIKLSMIIMMYRIINIKHQKQKQANDLFHKNQKLKKGLKQK